MTDALIAFLRARLDEDEVAAREAALPESHWRRSGPNTVEDVGGRPLVYGDGPSPSGSQADHIARHDPARVLADIDAKRRIIDLCLLDSNDEGEPICLGGYGEAYWDVVRILAQPYAEHPDYREEWRP